MRKFTNKQSIYVDKLLDEAWGDGYKAAEFDAKHQSPGEVLFNRFTLDPDKEELTNNLFTAEANMKRAEAEFNKRNEQSIEQRVQEQLGHPLYGRSPAFEAMYQIELMKELEYGTPDELYTFWGVRDDH